jgi:hypothetical protein
VLLLWLLLFTLLLALQLPVVAGWIAMRIITQVT